MLTDTYLVLESCNGKADAPRLVVGEGCGTSRFAAPPAVLRFLAAGFCGDSS